MLERVARTDYALLEERRGGNQTGSAINALWAALVFGVVLLLSLPLWLVPGLGLVIPLMLTAWLNRRAFRYDALMMHADREEMRTLSKRHDGSMLLLGSAAPRWPIFRSSTCLPRLSAVSPSSITCWRARAPSCREWLGRGG